MNRQQRRAANNKFASIPGYKNYKINRSGTKVINKNTDRELTIQRNTAEGHWSGRVTLSSANGTRRTHNILFLIQKAFRIKNEDTASQYMTT